MKNSIALKSLVGDIHDTLSGIFGAVRGPLVEISLNETPYPYEVCVRFVGDKSAFDHKDFRNMDQQRARCDGELFISAADRDGKLEERPPGSAPTIGILIHYHFRTKELK